jgi:hypothetical protein
MLGKAHGRSVGVVRGLASGLLSRFASVNDDDDDPQ